MGTDAENLDAGLKTTAAKAVTAAAPPETLKTGDTAKKQKKNPHSGHRQRMRERVLEDAKYSFSNFQNHELLEMLLYYTNRQKDTNQIAHELIDNFGSLHQVFDAPLGALERVTDVGLQSAFLIKLCREIAVRCMREEAERRQWKRIVSPEDAVEFFRPKFLGMAEEVVMAVYLDNHGTVILQRRFTPGQANRSALDIREIIRHAVNNNACSIILAHNHPWGAATPSAADRSTTNSLNTVMHSMKLRLTDHLIFGQNGTHFSMREAGLLSNFGSS